MFDYDVKLDGRTSRLRGEGVASPGSARLADWNPSRRPPRHPVTSVPSRLKDAAHLTGLKDPAEWALVSISAGPSLAHVRAGMTYDKDYGTSASFFEKPGRIQFLEGPNEPALADHFEMSPKFLDFQFQPLDLTFKRADGKLIHKYPDVALELEDHSVRFGEIKSNRAWFAAPGVRAPLDRVDLAIGSAGLRPLLRIEGDPFRRDRVIEAHQAAMDARLTTYDAETDVHTVRHAVLSRGQSASFGALFAALGGRRCNAGDKLYSMLLRRIVSFDLCALPTSDTSVTLPRSAKPYALREVLNRFRRLDA